jgi:hypothetical protein
MKNTHILSISLIVVSAAFVIVSILVTFTGGKNKYLIANKLRLGAIIIGMTAMANGCRPHISCYAPAWEAPLPIMYFADSIDSNGKIVIYEDCKSISFDCHYLNFENVFYAISSGKKTVCTGQCVLIKNEDKTSATVALPEIFSHGNYQLRFYSIPYAEIDDSDDASFYFFDLKVINK